MNGLNKEKDAFFRSIWEKRNYEHANSLDYVLVSYRVSWVDDGRTTISDQFIWSKQ